MKVATWNLDQRQHNATKWARQLEHIRRIDADVWVLTETYRDFSPGPDYRLVAYSDLAGDRLTEDGRWVAIWSRLEGEPIELSSDRERCAAIRLADSGLVIVGTVLPWNGTALFQQRLCEQTADWSRLGEEFGGRLCVLGDFNQDLLPCGHYFGSDDGKCALLSALADCELLCLTGGNEDPLAGVCELASIDHICIGPGVRALEPAEVWPAPPTLADDLSDHYGVCVDLEVV